MADEKYDIDPSTDKEQSGCRFVSTGPEADAIDYNCERLFAAMESFCGDKQIIPELPQDADEEADELDALFDDEEFPQPFIDLIYNNIDDIFKSSNNSAVIEFTFNVAFSLIFENPAQLNTNIDKLSSILSNQSEEFSKLNIKLFSYLPLKTHKISISWLIKNRQKKFIIFLSLHSMQNTAKKKNMH